MAIRVGGGEDVSYTISARDVSAASINSALAGTRRLEQGLEGLQTRMKAQFATIQKHWLGMTAAAYAAFRAIQAGWGMMERAADYQERINSLDALGRKYDMTGQQIVKSMKEASRGLLSLQEAADMSASAINLSLNPRQMIEFTQVAESLTDVIGGSIPEAFNRMTIAAASGRTQTLAQMGIIISLEDAYQRWAAANDRNVKSLSEAEKQQIRLNVILEAAKQKVAGLGPPQDTTRDKMDRLTASIKDAQLWMGQGLIRSAMAAYGAFQWLSSGTSTLISWFVKLWEWRTRLRAATTAWLPDEERAALRKEAEALAADVRALQESAVDLAGKAAENMKAALADATAFANAMNRATGGATGAPAPDTSLFDAKKIEDFRRIQRENTVQALKDQAEAVGAINRMNMDAFEQEAKNIAEISRMQLKGDQEAIKSKAERLQLESVMLIAHYEKLAENERWLRDVNRRAEVNDLQQQGELLEKQNRWFIAQVEETNKYRLKSAQSVTSGLMNLSEAFYSFSDKKNEEMFRITQALGIANAIVHTYSAATKALDEVPYPYNYVVMAATIAAGLANIANIASASYGGSTGAGGGAASAPIGTYPASPATGIPESGDREGQQSQTININIYGEHYDKDAFAREIVPQIQKAIEDGAH